MYKAIIFDCFNVLVTNGLPAIEKKYINNDSEKQNTFYNLLEALNSGKITYDIFLLKISELSGLELSKVRARLDADVPNIDLFDFISLELKPKYKIGMLSNAGDDWLDDMIGLERRSLFDSIVLSYKLGITKPHPDIYKYISNELEVNPNECIFIDDNMIFCKGAETVGMSSIRYLNLDHLKDNLSKIILV